MKSTFWGCAFASLLFASSSHAAEPSGFNHYVSLSAGKSIYSGESGDPILNLGLGHAFNSNLSVEVFARALSFRLQFFDSVVGDTGFYPSDHAGIAVLGSTAVSDSINAYGRLGIGRTTFEAATQPIADKHITDPSVGLGLVFGTTARVGAKLEATRFTRSNVTTILLGMDVRF